MNPNVVNEEQEIIEQEIDIDAFSNEGFDIGDSVGIAREQLDDLIQKNRMLSDFEEDIWVIKESLYETYLLTLDFNVFDSSFNKKLPKYFKVMVKCWVANLTTINDNFYPKFQRLKKMFIASKGFRIDQVKKLVKHIAHLEYIGEDGEVKEMKDNTKCAYIYPLLNFFDYSELGVSESYVPELINLLHKLSNVSGVRVLPRFKYVLAFSYYLNKYFEELLPAHELNNKLDNGASSNSYSNKINRELFKIYPIVLWWRITNLIPIRPTEFCLLERKNCLIVDGDKRYLRLSRRKHSTNGVQIVDKLLIDEETYELISYYIELTEQFGTTETLISYSSLIQMFPDTNRKGHQINQNKFTNHNLGWLIESFYGIMLSKYKIDVTKENRITPNITRHLAFISLMMQGYTPLEIARLGGHKTITTQFGYYNHTEHWVDCEVYRLMKRHKNLIKNYDFSISIPQEVSNRAIGTMGKKDKKLAIGFCKDAELMRCQSDIHILCDYWGCEPEEFIKHKPLVLEQLNKRKNRIDELTSVIYNINKQIMGDTLSKLNHKLYTDLYSNVSAVQSEIDNLAKIYLKFGEGMILDEH